MNRSHPRGFASAFAVSALCVSLVVSARAQSRTATPEIVTGPDLVSLQYAAFDPVAVGEPPIPATLQSPEEARLWIVQFADRPTDGGRAAVEAAGGELFGYLPTHAYVARMPVGSAASVATLPDVRWVGRYHPAYRLEEFLLAEHLSGEVSARRRYNVVVADKRADKPALGAKVRAIGGRVVHEQVGSLLFEVEVDGAQLVQLAGFDEVLWIDRWTPGEEDMDNARIQGGADFIEVAGGFTGLGLNGYVYEGINPTVADFTTTPTAIDCNSSSSHGHSTSTIIFGNGAASPSVRGLVPDAIAYYTNYTCEVNSRFQNVGTAVNTFECSFKTASWGGGRTTQYTSVSADTDDIVFAHDIPWTQSQSNAGNQDSRPQAWAKNVFSIGGVDHFNNATASDDSWQAGNGSTGPAADGRIKPTLSAYYDQIGTASINGGTTNFGGTSGATPICGGHNALAIQMFTDGAFGNTLRNPGGSRHSNRPHFTTLKALQVANATQYSFTSTSSDNRREHVGYGFPDLRTMWENRTRLLIVDETDLLQQGGSQFYAVTVEPDDQELKIALNWSEPAANPAAAITLVNDLTLRVTSPGGTVYYGNNGLSDGNYSTAGGVANTIDSLECVFVLAPQPGAWLIEVRADLVVADNHTETPQMDVDYGLVASFGSTPVLAGTATQISSGCNGTGTTPNVCAGNNENGGSLQGTSNGNEYAIAVVAPMTMQVSGFELYLQGGTSMGTSIYLDAGGVPALTPVRTGMMNVTGGPGFFQTTFTPVTIQAGERFYLGADYAGGQIDHPQLNPGNPGEAYFRQGGNNWNLSGVITRPSYRVQCANGGMPNAVPQLSVPEAPRIAGSYATNLTAAAPNTSAILFFGASSTDWLGVPLPLPLTVFGAPGCELAVSPDFGIGLMTDGNGTASYELALPADTSLVGATFFEQFFITDPGANTLGRVTTSAFELVVGS